MAKALEIVGEIDTSYPFKSVREATARFGGFGFWKPSSHNIPEAPQVSSLSGELQKELLSKEGETLKVLKSLESTKSIVEDLKSKLNLYKTTEHLAAICKSVELLNKRLEEERAALEKTQERLNSENATEISKEIQRLSHEAIEVDESVAEIEQRRNKIKTAEMSLVAATKMKEAARASEAVAIAEIKAITRRSRKTLEEGMEKMNTTKMEAEQRNRSSCSDKNKNPFPMNINRLNLMMNDDETSSSTMSIGEILRRKLVLAEETAIMNPKMSLGKILGNGKRTRFGFLKLSVMLNKESKKNKIALNLR